MIHKPLTPHISLILALIILIAATSYTLIGSYSHNQKHFGYILDDSYIQMAMAKNLVQHGVWGISKDEFVSASSSPLWTTILAIVYFMFGVNENAPWILSLLSAIGILIIIHRLLKNRSISNLMIFFILLTFIVLFPVIPLVRTGMEHLLHGLLAILFAWIASGLLYEGKSDKQKSWRITRDEWKLLALSPFLSTIRYEGLFEIAIVMLFFAIRKRFTISTMLGVFSIAPLLIFGLISVNFGNYIVPNTLLAKSELPGFASLGNALQTLGLNSFISIMKFPYLAFSFILVVFLFLYGYYEKSLRRWSRTDLFLMLFILTFLVHMQFVKAGWFYRYEAYLIGWGVVGAGISLYQNIPRTFDFLKNIRTLSYSATILFLLVSSGYLLLARGINSLKETIPSTTNIFEQQYQMGLFIREYYSGEAVVVNDIGAVSYLADFHCFDKVGLANIRVLRAIRSNSFTPESLRKMCDEAGVKIAIVYRSWLLDNPGIPTGWKSIGKWTIQNNIVCSSKTVDFIVVDPVEETRLRQIFREFSDKLPKSVIVKEIPDLKTES